MTILGRGAPEAGRIKGNGLAKKGNRPQAIDNLEISDIFRVLTAR
jgi:hypothetical protein